MVKKDEVKQKLEAAAKQTEAKAAATKTSNAASTNMSTAKCGSEGCEAVKVSTEQQIAAAKLEMEKMG